MIWCIFFWRETNYEDNSDDNTCGIECTTQSYETAVEHITEAVSEEYHEEDDDSFQDLQEFLEDHSELSEDEALAIYRDECTLVDQQNTRKVVEFFCKTASRMFFVHCKADPWVTPKGTTFYIETSPLFL